MSNPNNKPIITPAKPIKKPKLVGIKALYVNAIPIKKSIVLNTRKNTKTTIFFFSIAGEIKFSTLQTIIGTDRKRPVKKDIDIKSISMNTYTELYNLKLKLDYDYTSGKYATTNEQIAIGGEYNFEKNLFLKFTGTKDIDTNKNIGYQYGLLYEDNCLGVDLNYYRDMTIDRDIKESDGYSFTIVLKPFGSTRSYGKNKVFGPSIN